MERVELFDVKDTLLQERESTHPSPLELSTLDDEIRLVTTTSFIVFSLGVRLWATLP